MLLVQLREWQKFKLNFQKQSLNFCHPDPLISDQLGNSNFICPQKDCGASYAFATTGVLESSYSVAYGSLFNLSEQNLIDCSSKVVDRKMPITAQNSTTTF